MGRGGVIVQSISQRSRIGESRAIGRDWGEIKSLAQTS